MLWSSDLDDDDDDTYRVGGLYDSPSFCNTCRSNGEPCQEFFLHRSDDTDVCFYAAFPSLECMRVLSFAPWVTFVDNSKNCCGNSQWLLWLSFEFRPSTKKVAVKIDISRVTSGKWLLDIIQRSVQCCYSSIASWSGSNVDGAPLILRDAFQLCSRMTIFVPSGVHDFFKLGVTIDSFYHTPANWLLAECLNQLGSDQGEENEDKKKAKAKK